MVLLKKILCCGELLFDLLVLYVMGILNVMLDLFSDGGKYNGKV